MVVLGAIEEVAIKEGGTLTIGRKALRDALFATVDFEGVTSSLSCNEYGDCADRSVRDLWSRPRLLGPWHRYRQQPKESVALKERLNMSQEITHVPVNVIERFMVDVFLGLGTPEEDARICADVLIASDLRGIESHGVGRLKYYYDRIVAGVQFTKTETEIVKETETTALLDGHHGMGHVIAYRSMRLAMDKARQFGLGAVTVRNGTHFGIAGYYPLMAVKEGMMGFCVTNARPAIAPTLGAEPMLGTNPIAFAAPSDLPYPFCFDGATSITQRGKIEVAARADKLVPEGWVIDAQGNPLTNPHQILEDLGAATAALLPLGGAGELFAGYKGYDLATMVEILSASLSGGAFMKDLLGFAEDGSRRPYMLGHFFLALDIEHFIPLEVSRCITGQIVRALQASRKAPGQDRIYVAGEKEYEMEKIVRQRGVPVNQNLRQELQIMRDELNISGYEAYF
jgi:L-2-hydroxycarboxylate dehydrogenase (NAD+)